MTPEERIRLIQNRITNFYQEGMEDWDSELEAAMALQEAIVIHFPAKTERPGKFYGNEAEVQEALEEYPQVKETLQNLYQTAYQENINVKDLYDLNQKTGADEIQYLLMDSAQSISNQYTARTGQVLTSEQSEAIFDALARNIFINEGGDLDQSTASYYPELPFPDYLSNITVEETIEGEYGGPDITVIRRNALGNIFFDDRVLLEIMAAEIPSAGSKIRKYPTAYTKDRQISIIVNQLIQGGHLDEADRKSDIILRNIDNNLGTILQQIDELTGEGDNQSFANASDKLIDQIIDPSLVTTDSEKEQYAKYGYLKDFRNPELANIAENTYQQFRQQRLLQGFESQENTQKFINDASADFKKRIETRYPISETDPYKAEKEAALKDLIANMNQSILSIQEQGGSLTQQKKDLQELYQLADSNIENAYANAVFIAEEKQLEQDRLDENTRLLDFKDEVNKDPRSFQRQYLEAGPMEKAGFDNDLQGLRSLGFGVSPSGKIGEIPQFDPSTISDPSARAAMEQFMAYTQGLTAQEQFDMQLGGMPPSLPQDIMEGFEAIRPAKEGYTPIMDEQGNWTGDVLPLYPYGTSEEEKQSMIDDYRRQTTKRLPKTKMTPGVDYSLSIDEMEDDKGFNASYTLTPEGGLNQYTPTPEGGLDQKDLESNISEDFDLTPPAKPKVKTQEFDARF